MSKITDAFRDNFKFIGEELDGLKKAVLNPAMGWPVSAAIARERRLLADESAVAETSTLRLLSIC